MPSSPDAAPLTLRNAMSRYGIVPADLVGVLADTADAGEERDDEPQLAEGHRIVRVDVEEPFATVYLSLDDGRYLVYAARLDEEGAILLDSLRPPAPSYEERWIFDDLEGESGPPPAGTPVDAALWHGAAGRTLAHIGWYEEGMQVFLHFEEGGYLTLAARAAGGIAYLLGAFVPDDPAGDEEYLVFELPADSDE
ncbi:MAG TPA: hypothetical protein VKV26_07800 [Dehalococcoidia bacterium]|nr:hypothetical protein [Dehalococcoidia bacterium]